MVWECNQIFSGEDGPMCSQNMHFQNYNKIDYICKVGSLALCDHENKAVEQA